MRSLTLRRLFGLVGTVAVVSVFFFTAVGAPIDCTGQTECTGTDFSDNMTDSFDTEIMHGFGGDDQLISENPVGVTLEQVFGNGGDDTIHLNQTGNVHAFGGMGNDNFRLYGKTGEIASAESYTVDGGRGDDFIHVVQALTNSLTTEIKDGPGQDTILDNADQADPTKGSVAYTITLVADNEADTVRLSNNDEPQTIKLSKDGGREVINCGDTNNNDGDTVILNGNRKAVDPHGNNLYKAAMRGGTAESNCQFIMP